MNEINARMEREEYGKIAKYDTELKEKGRKGKKGLSSYWGPPPPPPPKQQVGGA
jgi:hypothetical protein